MSRYRHQTLWIFALLAALLIPSQGGAQSTTPILVCYPGGPVKDKEANNAMASMLRVVEKVGQWKSGFGGSVFG